MLKLLQFVLVVTLTVTSRGNCKLIRNLPGLHVPVTFKQYSGYITVDPSKGSRLFYWFVESQSNATSDPLVLWLNGGPGCSSLGGLLGELGPFYVKSDSSLGLNDESWNKIANMVFLESPAGVGFSKTDKTISYTDETTAVNSLTFLVKFFEMYPHLKNHDFWITGESYGGHYVPALAAKIIEFNKNQQKSDKRINLKGIMIGNPLTVGLIDEGAAVDYSYSHQLFSRDCFLGLRKYCNFTFPDDPHKTPDVNLCKKYQSQATKEIGPINIYSIYSDICMEQSWRYSQADSQAIVKMLANSNSELSTFWKGILLQQQFKSSFDPCQGNFISAYLNDLKVQKAIYAERSVWTDCSVDVEQRYSITDRFGSVLPIYNNTLFGSGIKILLYSGDVDTVVSAISTRRCLRLLNLKLTKSWHPWMDSRGQVGGYKEVYKQLTFATVRNAGHQVPTFQPGRAFDIFSRFLKGTF